MELLYRVCMVLAVMVWPAAVLVLTIPARPSAWVVEVLMWLMVLPEMVLAPPSALMPMARPVLPRIFLMVLPEMVLPVVVLGSKIPHTSLAVLF